MERDSADDSGDQGRERAARAAEDADLTESMTALSRLSCGRLVLADLLVQVASFAVKAIPGADGAGLTMIEAGRADTIVASAPFVGEIDDIQYGMGEGPCISHGCEGRTMRSGSLGDNKGWPLFGPRAGGLGVHSVLSLPLIPEMGVRRDERVRAWRTRSTNAARIWVSRSRCRRRSRCRTRRCWPNEAARGHPSGCAEAGGDRSGHRHPAEPQRDLRGRGLYPAP